MSPSPAAMVMTMTMTNRRRDGEIVDVTLTLSVPFADVLLFDGLVEHLWSDFPTALSVDATMMKQ